MHCVILPYFWPQPSESCNNRSMTYISNGISARSLTEHRSHRRIYTEDFISMGKWSMKSEWNLNDMRSLSEMKKAGDAVSANFFHLCNFFVFSIFVLHNFAYFYTTLLCFCTFCIFLLFFARLCVFLHVFFVLIFQAQKLCQCYFSRFFQLWSLSEVFITRLRLSQRWWHIISR